MKISDIAEREQVIKLLQATFPNKVEKRAVNDIAAAKELREKRLKNNIIRRRAE